MQNTPHMRSLSVCLSVCLSVWPSVAVRASLSHFGDGPNTVSESAVSNTELSEFFGSHRVLGRELSEFLLAY